MESISLSNLSTSYKTLLNNLDSNENFKNINEKSSLSDICKVHNIVDDMLMENELQIADINHMMNNYKKKHETIDQLKNIASRRNFLLIKQAISIDKWSSFEKKIIKDYNIEKSKVGKVILKLFNKYVKTWNSIDKFFDMDKNCKIKKIQVIDPEDMEYLSSKSK